MICPIFVCSDHLLVWLIFWIVFLATESKCMQQLMSFSDGGNRVPDALMICLALRLGRTPEMKSFSAFFRCSNWKPANNLSESPVNTTIASCLNWGRLYFKFAYPVKTK